MSKVMKDKVVVFTLSQTMRMPDMVSAGYQRREIVALFAELQAAGLGVYTEGTRGKGNAAVFEFWQDFPETYTMTFQVEKLHKDYAGKPGKQILDNAMRGEAKTKNTTSEFPPIPECDFELDTAMFAW